MVTTVTAVTIEIIQKWIEAVAILTFRCEGGREVAAEDEQGRFGHLTGFTVYTSSQTGFDFAPSWLDAQPSWTNG